MDLVVKYFCLFMVFWDRIVLMYILLCFLIFVFNLNVCNNIIFVDKYLWYIVNKNSVGFG